MRKILVKSPTRVDIAGGTIDLWPINTILGGSCTVNYAISVFTYVEIEEKSDLSISAELLDLGVKKDYPDLISLLNDQDPQMKLLRVFVEFYKPGVGFSIKTKSESPVGGGIGGSSSLCVSLINAFNKLLSIEMTTEQIVFLAHNLEAQVLGVPTGTQDYYPAVLGGLCVIDYRSEKTNVQKLPVPLEFLRDRSFIVYTGKPHHSGLNNWEVLKKFIEKDDNVVSCLKAIKRKAIKTREACLNKQWEALSSIFEESYKLRTKLSPVFTSPDIEKLKQVAHQSGASAVKICGAGGGGSVMIWTEPSVKGKVMSECQKAGFQILNAEPVELGSLVREL